MNPLFMIGIAPLSWRLGVTGKKPGKVVYALGPFRVSYHALP
jgi:hypothetical protein